MLAGQKAHLGAGLNGTNSGLHEARSAAAETVARLGFPAKKNEAWKYTNIRKEFDRPFALGLDLEPAAVDADIIEAYAIPGLDAYRIVLVNGCYSPALSDISALPKGFVLKDLRSASSDDKELFNQFLGRYSHVDTEVFEALNTAFVSDGVFVHVPKNTTIEKPVHIINIVNADQSVLIQPRILFAVSENAAATVIETSATVGTTDYLLNTVVELYSSRNARLEYYRLQLENSATTSVTSTKVFQEQSSYAKTTTITLGGKVVRNNLHFLPSGEHCESHLTGVVVADGSMHVDNHTTVDHAVPNCVSNELYKNILDEKATGIFNGRVLVRQDAQKTRAYQSNRAVVLSDSARMYSKPELEIYADDVLCSHGAATGSIDPESLFYLRSRGLSLDTARRMMLQAFSSDVTAGIGIEPLRQYVEQLIADRI